MLSDKMAQRWGQRLCGAFLMALSTLAGHAFASESTRTWFLDTSDPAQPASIGVAGSRAVTGDSNRRILRSPTLEVTAPEPKSRPTVVVRKTVPRYVPQRLRFNRVSIVGNPVEPRIRFRRDPEIFSMDSIKGEKIRGNFLQKVADDLNP